MVQGIGVTEEGERMTDASHVELHCEGIESDRDGTILDKPLSHLGFVLRYFYTSSHPDGHFGPVEHASLILPIVPILLLRLQPAYLQQGLVSIPHEASTTTHVKFVAIHQFLLGKTHQLTVNNRVLPFNIASHTEGPAGAAISLVLHLCNGSLLSPIERLGQLDVRNFSCWPVNLRNVPIKLRIPLLVTQIVPFELVFSEIRQMVDSIFGTSKLVPVQKLDSLHIAFENSVALLVFDSIDITFVMKTHETVEGAQAIKVFGGTTDILFAPGFTNSNSFLVSKGTTLR